MVYRRLIIIFLLLGALMQDILCQPSQKAQSVGLVLSGGGAKGIAHIGVIQALEDNGIPIDYVTGTSMGAIVGGLYAAGYTPQEMMRLLLSKEFSYWSTGKIDPRLVYYFTREDPSPAMLTIPISHKDSVKTLNAVPASIISPMPMSFAFMDLFSGYTAQCGGDFDRLFVPFRCVASDVTGKHKVVLSSGNLGDAIRASMSFPLVFQPISIDSTLLYDGGIYDNFPVDVMRSEFAPSVMIGVDVSTPSSGPQTSFIEQLENLVIQDNSYTMGESEGIKLHINLSQFGLLDFPKAQEIYEIGYSRASDMMDSIKARVKTRIPRQAREHARNVFKSHTPYVRFESVDITGGTPRQNDYISHLFTAGATDTIGITKARKAYYRAISPGKLQDLFPRAVYNDSTGLFRLSLKASVKNNLKVRFGGYITSSTNSYIFLSAGYSTLSFSSLSADISGWIGQSYLAGMLNGKMYLRTGIPSALTIQAVASRHKFYESDYLFYEDKMPSFILDHEYFVKLKWGIAAGNLSKVETGIGYGHLFDSFFRSNTEINYHTGRDRCHYDLGQAFIKFQSNTLDDISFPTSGNYYEVTGTGITGKFRQNPGDITLSADKSNLSWIQLESRTRNYLPIGNHWAMGIESDIMLSTRKLLDNYNAAIVGAPAYQPTPSSYNSFNTAFRANSFIAAGICPVYRYNDNLSARISMHTFLPLRKIKENTADYTAFHGKWLDSPEFFSEFAMTWRFPFASISGYCNYTSYPSHNWNVGISFGIFMLAPRFLR